MYNLRLTKSLLTTNFLFLFADAVRDSQRSTSTQSWNTWLTQKDLEKKIGTDCRLIV
jgi:hypothetical protein